LNGVALLRARAMSGIAVASTSTSLNENCTFFDVAAPEKKS
jgi:hypothetical protein